MPAQTSQQVRLAAADSSVQQDGRSLIVELDVVARLATQGVGLGMNLGHIGERRLPGVGHNVIIEWVRRTSGRFHVISSEQCR